MPSFAVLFAITAAAVSSVHAQVSSDMIEAFLTAPSAVNRVNSLGPGGTTFDFGAVLNKAPAAGAPAGGRAAAATTSNFLWGVNQGISMTVGLLEACGLNTPHSHPRSAEFLIPINGTLQTQMITENGAGTVTETLQPLRGILYSQGSLHFQFNDNCDETLFVSGFRDSDPGTLSAAQRLFGFNEDIVEADLLISPATFAKIALGIPDTFALGAADCRKRCGLDNVTQPTAQLQSKIDAQLNISSVATSTASSATASGSPSSSVSVSASTSATAYTSAYTSAYASASAYADATGTVDASGVTHAAPSAAASQYYKRDYKPVYLRRHI